MFVAPLCFWQHSFFIHPMHNVSELMKGWMSLSIIQSIGCFIGASRVFEDDFLNLQLWMLQNVFQASFNGFSWEPQGSIFGYPLMPFGCIKDT